MDRLIGDGFQAFAAALPGRRFGFDHLNPQTQERVIKGVAAVRPRRGGGATSGGSTQSTGGSAVSSWAGQIDHLAP